MPQEPVQPVHIVLPGVDPDRPMLAGVDVSAGPLYTIGEVSKSFFELTKYWIRWLDEKGLLEAEEVDPATGQTVRVKLYDRKPTPRGGKAGARSFSLAHIEAIVHALAGAQAIDGEDAARALAVVYAVARVKGYLPDQVGADRQDRVERAAIVQEMDQRLRADQALHLSWLRPLVDRLAELERGQG